jgi:hypothetical protein
MKKVNVGILLAGMLLAGEADAGSFRVWGEGVILCDTWISDRHSDLTMVNHEFSWVEGYITGLNSGLPSTSSNNGQVGEHIAAEGAKVWLDNYCQSHPLDTLAQAADKLYDYARSQNK